MAISKERKIKNLESTLKDYNHNLAVYKMDYKEAIKEGNGDQNYIDYLEDMINEYEIDIRIVENTLSKLLH